ncbi:energy-coupling factor transporter transmembrane protein EcfT [Candidatus Gracilibacteria bacterium]|nr:energy-coupling factor transporter transmembrane protein EcfT [Candidatus Gracilibacteria bacterium]
MFVGMIASFKYYPSNSPIHRLDPRTKFALLLVATFSAALLPDLRVLLVLLALAVLYYSLARLPWQQTRTAWSFFIFFIVVVVGFNTVIAGAGSGGADSSPVLLPLPLGLDITWRDVINALSIMMRMLIGAFMAIPITFTIKPTRFGVAFRGMGLGDRIAFAVDLAIRLVPTYGANFASTVDAQRARGFEFDKLKGGIIARLQRLAPLAVPVTLDAIVSGEDIANALDMRGFGTRPRTWIHARRLAPVDWILLALGAAILVGCLWWRVAVGGELWLPPFPL